LQGGTAAAERATVDVADEPLATNHQPRLLSLPVLVKACPSWSPWRPWRVASGGRKVSELGSVFSLGD